MKIDFTALEELCESVTYGDGTIEPEVEPAPEGDGEDYDD